MLLKLLEFEFLFMLYHFYCNFHNNKNITKVSELTVEIVLIASKIKSLYR